MMFQGLRGTRASDHLDMVRGLAAVAVLWYHVRYRFFLDFADVAQRGPLATGWYALTAFGHDAVMVFFVVSGFLVGSAAIRDCRAGRWSWTNYLTARAVRLYVVLVPGLLLTMFWDRLGLRFFGDNPVYSGTSQWYRHDFFNVTQRAGIDTFIGNLGFLQGILYPTFGSNDALWSLAFEFWYYIAFAMLAVGVFAAGSRPARLLWVLSGVAVLYAAGGTIATYFSIWLLGLGVGMMPSSAAITRSPRRFAVIAAGLFVSWLLLSHISAVKSALGNSLWAEDSCTGVLFAAWLYVFLHDRRAADAGVYGIVARRLANSSYTLYVVHLPLLIFLRGWLVPGDPWAPTPVHLLAACVIASLALAYAIGLASITEAHTATIRRACLACWAPAPRALDIPEQKVSVS